MSCNGVFFCFQMVVDGAKIMFAVRLSTINYIGGAKLYVHGIRYWGIVRVSCRVRYYEPSYYVYFRAETREPAASRCRPLHTPTAL